VINLSSRYRFVQSSADEITANQLQFKDAFRARFHIDRDRRFTIDVGAFSGSSFTSSWDATGLGTGRPNGDMFVKQLYASIKPASAFDVQLGGLYLARGESTEITSYDDDGYLTGERIAVRRPGRLYFDEVSITGGALDPEASPGVIGRLHLLGRPNYWQAQVVKHVASQVSASADFTDVAGAQTARAAVAFRFVPGTPLSAIRYEQYRRLTHQPASGWALTAERQLTGLRLQAGYADIDAAYGGLNGDRYQRGRRLFTIATIPIGRAFSAQLFLTRALPGAFAVTNRTRFDAVVSYDLLGALRGHR
jgi:hypothetical protein